MLYSIVLFKLHYISIYILIKLCGLGLKRRHAPNPMNVCSKDKIQMRVQMRAFNLFVKLDCESPPARPRAEKGERYFRGWLCCNGLVLVLSNPIRCDGDVSHHAAFQRCQRCTGHARSKFYRPESLFLIESAFPCVAWIMSLLLLFAGCPSPSDMVIFSGPEKFATP